MARHVPRLLLWIESFAAMFIRLTVLGKGVRTSVCLDTLRTNRGLSVSRPSIAMLSATPQGQDMMMQ